MKVIESVIFQKTISFPGIKERKKTRPTQRKYVKDVQLTSDIDDENTPLNHPYNLGRGPIPIHEERCKADEANVQLNGQCIIIIREEMKLLYNFE